MYQLVQNVVHGTAEQAPDTARDEEGPLPPDLQACLPDHQLAGTDSTPAAHECCEAHTSLMHTSSESGSTGLWPSKQKLVILAA